MEMNKLEKLFVTLLNNQKMKNKKSQAALEFLTTYAWAFLVIIIMVGALAYFGVLSPSKLLPDRCNFGSEISCMQYVIKDDGLQLKLKNNLGSTIVVDSLTASTKKAQLSCGSSIIGTVWEAGEIKDIPVVCGFADAGLVESEKGKINLEIKYHPLKSGITYSKSIQGEVLAVVGSGGLGGGILFDNFDTQDNSIWVYNTYQTVPFDDSGNNVVRNIGVNNWNANFYRGAFSLSNGDLVQLEFKVDVPNTAAHFSIEAWNPVYNRWGVIANNNVIYVQYQENGGAFQLPKTLINPLKLNTWYVVLIRVDNNQFYIRVYEKNNPDIFGDYSRAMPVGLAWRFRHWIYRNTAYIDNYFET